MWLLQCVDIEFAEPGDPKIPEVNESNCFNSADLGMADIYTIVTRHPETDETSDAEVRFWYFGKHRSMPLWQHAITWGPAILGGMWLFS